MIVVDLGCAVRGHDPTSLQVLAAEYHPDLIYGFDPFPDHEITEVDGIPVQLTTSAAWLFDGEVEFTENGAGSHVGTEDTKPSVTVPCFDFSTWLKDIGPCAVKMDIEGAEYELLRRMISDGTDELLVELLVEWHSGPDAEIARSLRCPFRDWWM